MGALSPPRGCDVGQQYQTLKYCVCSAKANLLLWAWQTTRLHREQPLLCRDKGTAAFSVGFQQHPTGLGYVQLPEKGLLFHAVFLASLADLDREGLALGAVCCGQAGVLQRLPTASSGGLRAEVLCSQDVPGAGQAVGTALQQGRAAGLRWS